MPMWNPIVRFVRATFAVAELAKAVKGAAP
jgi:hypothetical protein